MKQIYVIGSFRVKENGRKLKIATTHLKAKAGNEQIRESQAKQLSRELRHLDNIIITGDFNDVPESGAIEAMKKAKFVDATELTDESQDRITTLKYREAEGLQKRRIDYVFTKSQEMKGV